MPENGFYGFPCAQSETARDFRASGKPGATAGADLAGGTISGAPTSGYHHKGEVVVDQAAGTIWICTAAGTPGTWTQVVGGSGSYTLPDATTSAIGGLLLDEAPPSGHPVALTAPRLGGGAGVAPLGPDQIVPSGYLPPPAPTGSLAESARWTRSGSNPVLSPALAWEATAVYEPTVLWDGTQFVMYYGGGWASAGIGRATSPDGITWTKYSGNPVVGQGGSGIAGFAARNCTLHVLGIPGVGAAYYMYYSDAVGGGNIRLATSADGLTWTAAGIVLAAAAAGWVSPGWANSHVWYDAPTATWHMLVEGKVGSIWKTGHSTSADGQAWTAPTGPLAGMQQGTGAFGGPWLPLPATIGGLYQAWYHAATSSTLPTDLYRATSPDLVTWTPISGAILTHTGSGFEIDQVADPCALEVHGQTYLYYSGMDNPSSAGHIGVAIFAGPLADLISGCGLPALLNGSGLLPQSQGGTGLDTSGATNGQVLIGKTSDHSLGLATLTAGSNVTVTNGAGTITVAASGGLADPTTTEGDLLYRHSSALGRLAVGATAGYALLSNATDPYWADAVASGPTRYEPVCDTGGSVLVNAAGDPIMALAGNN